MHARTLLAWTLTALLCGLTVPSCDGEGDAAPCPTDVRPAEVVDAATPPCGMPDVAPSKDAAEDATSDVWVDASVDAAADAALGDAGDSATGRDVTLPTFEGTGFFRVEERGGRWWLVTPEGAPFYSTGCNTVNPTGDTDSETGEQPYADAVAERYADEDAWAEETERRLRDWGFNTLGAWSRTGLFASRMPYTEILYMSGADWVTGEVPDYFAPAFEDRCKEIAAQRVAPLRDDPLLLGWFIDNEQRWGPDYRSSETLLHDYLALPEGAPGRLVAELYGDDDQAFLLALAARFFAVTTAAIRAEDPNHLILGVRSVSIMTPPEVPAAAAAYVDVYSVNNYVFRDGIREVVDTFGPHIPADDWLVAYYEETGRPILITEFSFRADDSGLPNDWPPIYPTYATQEERADAFESYVTSAYERPYIVGHHWFEWVDEPPGGRFDGENSNFGLVDTGDVPYEVLTERMRAVHALAPDRTPR